MRMVWYLVMVWLGMTASTSWAEPTTVDAAQLLAEETDEEPTTEKPADASMDETIAEANLGDGLSFGSALGGLGSRVSLSGYGDLELSYQKDGTLTFDLLHTNAIIGAQLPDGFYAEFEIEMEHGGEEFFLEYGYLDWRLSEQISLRIGKFLLPVGYFNEHLHPSFRNRLISRPLMTRRIIPSTWADSGIQLRGGFRVGTMSISTRLFVVNGLQEKGGEQQVEAVRSMRHHNVDLDDSDKSFGGALTLQVHPGEVDVRFGLSGFHGAISTDGERRITMAAADLRIEISVLQLEAESVHSWVEVPGGGTDQRRGFYGQLSVQVAEKLFLSARYDYVDEDGILGVTHQGVGGLLYRFNHHVRAFIEGSGGKAGGMTIYGGRGMMAFSF